MSDEDNNEYDEQKLQHPWLYRLVTIMLYGVAAASGFIAYLLLRLYGVI